MNKVPRLFLTSKSLKEVSKDMKKKTSLLLDLFSNFSNHLNKEVKTSSQKIGFVITKRLLLISCSI